MTYPLYPHATGKAPDVRIDIESVSSYYSAQLCSIFQSINVIEAISGKSRKSQVALARHCYRWLMHQVFNYSAIASFTNCDHTTVIHSVRYVNELLPIQNKKLHKQITSIAKP